MNHWEYWIALFEETFYENFPDCKELTVVKCYHKAGPV